MTPRALDLPTWMLASSHASPEAVWQAGRAWSTSGASLAALETTRVAAGTSWFLDDAAAELDPTRPGLRFQRAAWFLGGAREVERPPADDEVYSRTFARLVDAPWAALALLLLGRPPLQRRVELRRCVARVVAAYDELSSFRFIEVVPVRSFTVTRTGGLRPNARDTRSLDEVLEGRLAGVLATWGAPGDGAVRDRLDAATQRALDASHRERDERALTYLTWRARTEPRLRNAARLTSGGFLRPWVEALPEAEREALVIGASADCLQLLLAADRSVEPT